MFGEELRKLRNDRNMSLRSCAGHVNYSPGQLSKVETGKRAPTRSLARAVDRLFQTDGLFEQLQTSQPDAVASAMSGSNEPLIAYELVNGKVVYVPASRRDFLRGIGAAAAVSLVGATPSVTPALPADIPPLSHFQHIHTLLIDTDKTMGATAALQGVRDQLHAIDTIRRSSRGADGRALAHMQCEFTELAGWLHQDLGEFDIAGYYLDRALELSYPSGDPELTTFVIARKSQLAGDMRDGSTAVLLAQAAAQQSPNQRLVAIAKTYEAYGHALLGETADVERTYDAARVSAADFRGPSPWGPWLDTAYIDVHRGRSMSALGRHAEAADIFRGAVAELPSEYYRERGLHLAREALAHAGAHNTDAAVSAGLSALSIAQTTRSGRTAADLHQLDRALSDQRSHSSSAATFRTAMQDAMLTVA